MVTVAGALAGSDDSARAAAARDRTVTDMPDDISGPQVHFLYVVPADGADRQLDTNGEMEQSITRIERWFVDQSVEQALRVDTHRGAPDISFMRLPQSDAQAAATLYGPQFVMGEDLVAAGFQRSVQGVPSHVRRARLVDVRLSVVSSTTKAGFRVPTGG